MQLPAPEFSLKHLLQVTGGLVAAVWIQLPEATQTLLIFMGLDMLSGILAGAKLKRLSSDTMYVGLLKKCLVLILVAAGHQLKDLAHMEYNLGTAIALGYVVYEFLSIIENAGRAGVPFPPVITQLLEKLNSTNVLGRSKPNEG